MRGLKIRILRRRLSRLMTALRPEALTTGHIKAITTGRLILGATIVGAQAGELITTWTLAIAQKSLNIQRNDRHCWTPSTDAAEIGKRCWPSTFFAQFDEAYWRLINGTGSDLSAG